MVTASVIIPTFNEEQYLGSCLEKLADQTFKNFEVIVSDCSSTDRTKEIAKRYCVRLVLSPKINRASACNEALKHARGAYILFTDADVDVPPDWVGLYVDYLDKNKDVDLVGAPNITHPSDGFIAKATGALKNISAPVYIGTKLVHVPACNCAYRGTVFQKIKFDPGVLTAEDMDVNLKLVLQRGNIHYTDMPKVFHHRRDNLTRFSRQMFKYGVGYIQLWLKYKNLLGRTQMAVTLSFPAVLFLLFLLGMFYTAYFWYGLGFIYLIYFLRNVSGNSLVYSPILPFLSFWQHLSFSYGAWYELLNQKVFGMVYSTHHGEK